MPQRVVFLLLFFAVVLVGGGIGLQAWLQAQGPRAKTQTSSGEAAIGGPFELVDTKGDVRRDSDFRGRYMLVFFGYTHCPDVCPTTLFDLTGALDMLGADAKNIQPIFITVDPLRDTPKVIAEYLQSFHPSFIGLTGTRQQLATVERLYGIYAKAAAADAKNTQALVDHTALVYLMGPDGKFRTYLSPGIGAKAIAEKIRKFL